MALQSTKIIEFKASTSDQFFDPSPNRNCIQSNIVTISDSDFDRGSNIRLSDYTGTLGGGGGLTHYYKMRGKDIDCVGPVTYRSWVVTGVPDSTGVQYTGPKCGASPLTEITIEDKWDV